MKLYFLNLFFLFICNPGNAQTSKQDSSASCVAIWKKGDSKILNIKHTKVKFQNDSLRSIFTLSYEAHITVLEESDTGYTMQWIFHLPQLVKLKNPRLGDSLPVFEGMEMIYEITDMGVFKRLVNWQEVKDAYVKMMMVSLPKNLDTTAESILQKPPTCSIQRSWLKHPL